VDEDPRCRRLTIPPLFRVNLAYLREIIPTGSGLYQLVGAMDEDGSGPGVLLRKRQHAPGDPQGVGALVAWHDACAAYSRLLLGGKSRENTGCSMNVFGS